MSAKPKAMVLPPALYFKGEMEVHTHRCPRGLQEELDAVFPDQRGTFREAIVVTTAQRASVDLVGVGPRVELEKDVLLKRVRGSAVGSSPSSVATCFPRARPPAMIVCGCKLWLVAFD